MKADDQARRDHRRSGPGRSRSSRARSERRRGFKRYLGPLAAILAVIGAYLLYAWESTPVPAVAAIESVDAVGKPVERTAALAPLKLPADDAPHGSGIEWWYYNGILDDPTGNHYSFHAVVFVANGLIKHTVMQAALTDLQTGKRYTTQSRTGGIPANDVANGFDFRQDGWQIAGSGPSHVLRAAFQGVSFALDLTDTREAVLHRAAGSETPGLLDFGKGGISYYYSRPRVSALGELSIGGKTVPVKGEVWFDHQWGDFDALGFGWNWFALHLADGSDLMLYAIFDADGQKMTTAGTLSNARGAAPLNPGEVELTPGKTWTSPATGIAYVLEWSIKLPSGVLNVKPLVADEEFDARETTSNIYWEGPVKVTGSAEGQGFLELSGYDRLSTARSNRK